MHPGRLAGCRLVATTGMAPCAMPVTLRPLPSQPPRGAAWAGASRLAASTNVAVRREVLSRFIAGPGVALKEY